MFGIEHLVRPLKRSVRNARLRFGMRFDLRRFVAQSDAHFRDDPRYQARQRHKRFRIPPR